MYRLLRHQALDQARYLNRRRTIAHGIAEQLDLIAALDRLRAEGRFVSLAGDNAPPPVDPEDAEENVEAYERLGGS